MRITNNYTQKSSTNFGNVIATEKAIKYMNTHLSPAEIAKTNEIIKSQVGKKPNIHLHTGSFIKNSTNTEMVYLRAQVDDKLYKEGLFTSAFGVVKKAANYVDSLQKKVTPEVKK